MWARPLVALALVGVLGMSFAVGDVTESLLAAAAGALGSALVLLIRWRPEYRTRPRVTGLEAVSPSRTDASAFRTAVEPAGLLGEDNVEPGGTSIPPTRVAGATLREARQHGRSASTPPASRAHRIDEVVEIARSAPDPRFRLGADAALSLQSTPDGTWLIARTDAHSECRLGSVPLTLAAVPITSRARELTVVDAHGRHDSLDLGEFGSDSPDGYMEIVEPTPASPVVLAIEQDGVVAAVWSHQIDGRSSAQVRELLRSVTATFIPGHPSQHSLNALNLLLAAEFGGANDALAAIIGAGSDRTVTVAASEGLVVIGSGGEVGTEVGSARSFEKPPAHLRVVLYPERNVDEQLVVLGRDVGDG